MGVEEERDLRSGYDAFIVTTIGSDSGRMRRLGIITHSLDLRFSEAFELFGDSSEYPEITLV